MKERKGEMKEAGSEGLGVSCSDSGVEPIEI